MRCPFCNETDSQVKDSRPAEDAGSIRRRRQCPGCGARFTTFERVQLRELMVIKANGSVEPYDREKLIRSMKTSLRKRPVPFENIEKVGNAITRQLETSGDNEVTTLVIGQMVMDAMEQMDKIGYVRYASVYKDFRETEDFNAFLDKVKEKQAN